MAHVFRRSRIFAFPHDETLFDSRLDLIYEEPARRGSDIVFALRVFRPLDTPEARTVDGVPHEWVRGEYLPVRLRFSRASWLWRTGPFERFNSLPDDHGARRVFSIPHTRHPDIGESYVVSTDSCEAGTMGLRARGCTLEPADGEPHVMELLRRWARTPPSPAGQLPHRIALYYRYGGDPITIRLGGRVFHSRLFIGGLHHQRDTRPNVDAVLNLCGIENAWSARLGRCADDRVLRKGEGRDGMSAEELLAEATWVVERLRAGQRVLVHCFAGYNRSSTVCCASLMLLEGLSPEAALARVREHHPMAYPDPYYWFVLQWLARSRQPAPAAPAAGPVVGPVVGPVAEPVAVSQGAPLLREVGEVT
jgi:hypothetical protein